MLGVDTFIVLGPLGMERLNGSFEKMGVLFWGAYVSDPIILGPSSVPLTAAGPITESPI